MHSSSCTPFAFGGRTMSSPRSAPSPSSSSLLEHIIIHYRWIFVLFLLPVSAIYDVLYYARSSFVFWMNSAPNRHAEKVREVQRQVRKRLEEGDERMMCTARPGWQTISPQNMSYKEKMRKIRVDLVDVLEIDSGNRTVTCEPLVSMGQLTHTLNRLGWTIPIVPELDDLTVGGLIMGTGIETSSHRHGLFQHVCVEYELVMADGSAVTCSENENSDLFYAVPWSYGTLGFLVSAKIKILPSRRFVKLNYEPVRSLKECTELMKSHIDMGDNAPEFIEALVFSKTKAVVMTGDMVDSCDGDLSKLNEIGTWHKPWFFKHVEGFADHNVAKATEYIPLRDYYHRHSRSIFWEIQDIIPFGNHPVFRHLFGFLVPPKVSLLKLTQGETIKKLYENHHVIQDMLVPLSDGAKSLEFFDNEVEIYPVWLCPFRLPVNPGMLNTNTGKEEMYLDIGVYGVPKAPFKNEETTRKIEEFVRKHSGFQMMYADSYMTKTEFRSMFDHKLYDEMRQRYGCVGALPDVYDKVNKKARSSQSL